MSLNTLTSPDENKEKIVHRLLDSSKPSTKRNLLIEEVDPDHVAQQDNPTNIVVDSSNLTTTTEGPSLLELMMEAQNSAAKEKEKELIQNQQKEAKKSFSGFKKGFLGGGENNSNPSQLQATLLSGKAQTVNKAEHITPVVANRPDKVGKAPILQDVQSALDAEESEKKAAMLLQNKDWMTNDLLSQFQLNPVLAEGFKNQKCLAAMQLMQSNPKEALQKFQNDAEVSKFLKEFGAVMSEHFTKLGAQIEQKTDESQKPSTIQEIGPLQAKMLKESKKMATSSGEISKDADEAKVQKILKDNELRDLLMNAEFQKILVECSNPKRLAHYMQQPIIASQIRKLHQAGLVKIEF